jgi:hypothetical protein
MEPVMHHRMKTVCAAALALVLLGCGSQGESTKRHDVLKPVVLDGKSDVGEIGTGAVGGGSHAVSGGAGDAAAGDGKYAMRLAEKESG